MRIPSGTTDRYVYFVAVDSTDLKTRETGLTTFTVYRSRNGGAAAAMTTPTVNETSSANMPGVYELLLDEDTTLTAGNDTEELCLHITQASMAPVTRVVEIYRPETTEGNTLGVAADGDISGNIDGAVAGSVLSVVGNVGGDVEGEVQTISSVNVTQISGDTVAANNLELDYDGTGYNKSASTIGTCTTNTDMLTAAAVNAEVADVLDTDTYAELGAVPAATSSLKDKITWLFMLARNKVTQTATTSTLRNDADGADVSTSTVSDDGTTFTRGEWS